MVKETHFTTKKPFIMLLDQEGLPVTRTQAYKFIKELLGVKPKILIKRDFFNLFFVETDHQQYILRVPESTVISIFTEKDIKAVNALFYKKKQERQTEDASQIYRNLCVAIRGALTAA